MMILDDFQGGRPQHASPKRPESQASLRRGWSRSRWRPPCGPRTVRSEPTPWHSPWRRSPEIPPSSCTFAAFRLFRMPFFGRCSSILHDSCTPRGWQSVASGDLFDLRQLIRGHGPGGLQHRLQPLARRLRGSVHLATAQRSSTGAGPCWRRPCLCCGPCCAGPRRSHSAPRRRGPA